MAIHIHQIFYDDRSRAAVHPDLIPLDNTGGRADWFEFWPIREYLRRTPLVEGDWYRFLSPKFAAKYCDPSCIRPILEGVPQSMDVVLFSPGWDQAAYFLNCFEQGEHWTQ